ncbi:MAG: response regulator [Asticcacaulis sp.]
MMPHLPAFPDPTAPPGDARPCVLVVDDTEDIRLLLETALRRKGFRILTADGGKEMDAILATTRVDLIVLDSVMPGEDGLSICKRLREDDGPPVIMLSAKGEDLDRIRGLERGAEDYMAKPFNPDELAARIRVVLRRQPATAQKDAGTRTVFGWALEHQSRKLTSPQGHALLLTTAEYAVLNVFLANPDRPLKREFILTCMEALHAETTARALDTVISRLRRKLDAANPGAPEAEELIRTVYGTGYMLRPGRR